MGVVLKVAGDVPKGLVKHNIWEEKQEYDYQKLETVTKYPLVARASHIVDLTKLLSDAQIKDCFNHDLLVDPITVNKSYLDLLIPRDQRTTLHPYDKSGSFASGNVDVGPNGHSDANTFFEFESNIADPLTGNLTGNTDEGSWSETDDIYIIGTTTASDKVLTFSASGDGRHGGKWDSGAHYFDLTNEGFPIRTDEDYINFDGLQFKMTSTTTNSRGLYVGAASEFNASNLVLWGVNTGAAWNRGAMVYAPGAWSNIVLFGTHQYAMYIGGSIDIVNCGFYGDGVGTGLFGASGTINAYNSVVINWGTGVDFNGTFNTIDYCAHDDAEAGETNRVSIVGQTASNYAALVTDGPNGDFTPTNTSSALYNAGDDDPLGDGTGSPDAAGNSRSTWDVGPIEYQAPAGGNAPTGTIYGPLAGPLGGPI